MDYFQIGADGKIRASAGEVELLIPPAQRHWFQAEAEASIGATMWPAPGVFERFERGGGHYQIQGSNQGAANSTWTKRDRILARLPQLKAAWETKLQEEAKPKTLEAAKAEKDRLIEAERDRRMATVQWIQNPGTSDETTYPIKATSDWTNLMDRVKSMLDRPAIAATFPRIWHGTIGPRPTLTVDEFLDMVDTVFLTLDDVYQVAAKHRQGLTQLTTIKAVQAYSPWPE